MAGSSILIYGANGYTGALLARQARDQGLAPILAGRSHAVEALAQELGFEARRFGLDDPSALERGLAGAAVVLHCAGPFSRTSRPMADACLRTGTHYADITGEASVFEALAERDAEARARGVMLLPGAGMDVVPSDCLASHLKRRLATATRLVLAFSSSAGISRGTATTMLENLPRGGLVRKAGRLERVPLAWKMRDVDFGNGPRHCVSIPWGDVSTAFHSTGIPDVEVYTPMRPGRAWSLRALRPFAGALGWGPIQAFLKRRVRGRAAGPSDAARARGIALFWGEVEDSAGRRARARQSTPEGYTLTAMTALSVGRRVLSGHAPAGFQTPSRAYGADFILEHPGCSRQDL